MLFIGTFIHYLDLFQEILKGFVTLFLWYGRNCQARSFISLDLSLCFWISNALQRPHTHPVSQVADTTLVKNVHKTSTCDQINSMWFIKRTEVTCCQVNESHSESLSSHQKRLSRPFSSPVIWSEDFQRAQIVPVNNRWPIPPSLDNWISTMRVLCFICAKCLTSALVHCSLQESWSQSR